MLNMFKQFHLGLNLTSDKITGLNQSSELCFIMFIYFSFFCLLSSSLFIKKDNPKMLSFVYLSAPPTSCYIVSFRDIVFRLIFFSKNIHTVLEKQRLPKIYWPRKTRVTAYILA